MRSGREFSESSSPEAAGVRFTLASQGVRIGCKAASLLVMPRLVPPEDHGLFAMSAALIMLLSLLRDFGLGRIAAGSPEINTALGHAILRVHVALGAALFAAALILAPQLGAISGDQRIVPIARVSAASFLLLGFSAWPRVQLMRNLQVGELARIETAGAVTATLAMIAAAMMGAGPYCFAIYLLTAEAIHLALTFRRLTWGTVDREAWRGLVKMLRAGSHVTLQTAAGTVAQQAELLLVGLWFGPAALGAYQRPAQMLALTQNHFVIPLTQLLQPMLARFRTNPDDQRRRFREVLGLTGYLTFPAAALCVTLPGEITHLVFGDGWSRAADVLPWLAITVSTATVSECLAAVCLAVGKPGRLGFIAATGLIATGSGLILGRDDGVVGVAATIAAASLLLLPARIWWCTSEGLIRSGDVARALLGPALTAAAAGSAAAVASSVAASEFPGTRLITALAAATLATASLGLSGRMRAEWISIGTWLNLAKGMKTSGESPQRNEAGGITP
jgi:O-antigen/teichoic acid export membrane protein